MFLRLFHVCHVIRNRRSALFVFFFGKNAFHVKAKNEKFIAADLRCRQNNMKISRRSLADYVKNCTKNRAARAARLFFPHPTNQIINLWR